MMAYFLKIYILTSYLLLAVAVPSLRQQGKARGYSLRPKSAARMSNGRVPKNLRYEMILDGVGDVDLDLELDPHMNLPVNSAKRDSVKFFRDRNGRGSYACEVTLGPNGDQTCELSGIATVGGESCFVGRGAKSARCTEDASVGNGTLRYYRVPEDGQGQGKPAGETVFIGARPSRADKPPRSGRKQGPRNGRRPPSNTQPNNRVKRTGYTAPGLKVIEMAFILDEPMMRIFYEMADDNVALGQEYAELFMTLFANELNVYYSSIKEITGGELDIYVYPSAIIYPEYGTNFAWSTDYSYNDNILNVDGTFDQTLRDWINSGITDKPWEHAMVVTGYNLYSGGGGLLGYAYMGTVCTAPSTYRYSINEYLRDNIFQIAAHELGHALGADHDSGTDCPGGKYVMSPWYFRHSGNTVDTQYGFSTCSVAQIQAHLEKFSDCTASHGFTDDQFKEALCNGMLGGQDNSLDQQCKRQTRYADSIACKTFEGDTGCQGYGVVTCKSEERKCNKALQYMWNGTPCGDNKMCYKGKCVDQFSICPQTSPTDTCPPCECP